MIKNIELDEIYAELETYKWSFPDQFRLQIESEWQKRILEKPSLFNGKILLQSSSKICNRVLKTKYFITDYANLIAQQVLQLQPTNVRNGFAMAALHTNDGAFLLGEMATHTHNAGRVYFPSGTPDLSDILPDGTINLTGSVLRELEEETGLTLRDVKPATTWTMVEATFETALMKPIFIDLPSKEARNRIISNIKKQARPELAEIHIVYKNSNLSHLPDFMRAYLEYKFNEY